MNPIIRAALTQREAEVAEHLLAGCSNRAIAEALGVGERTVKQYMRQMFLKFQIRGPLGSKEGGKRILLARALLALPMPALQ